MELLEASKTILQSIMGAKKGEKVLIIVDETTEEIGQALWEAGISLSTEALLVKMKEREYHADEPPQPIAEAMLNSDVIIVPTAKSLSHTNARREATKRGARIATMPGMTKEIVCRSISPNVDEIKERTEKIVAVLSEADNVRITTEKGMDLTLSIKGRRGIPDPGVYREKGTFGNLPAGEGFAAPVEGTANGTIICDGSIGGIGTLKEDMIVTVKNGFMTEIVGDDIATKFKEAIKPHGKNGNNIAELGVGTNNLITLSGNTIEDEKVMGTVHIGVGANKAFGGEIDLPFHTDMVIQKPTLEIDGKIIIEKGNWTI